jgi:hypothetical protein
VLYRNPAYNSQRASNADIEAQWPGKTPERAGTLEETERNQAQRGDICIHISRLYNTKGE